jgi:hypothetical protein
MDAVALLPAAQQGKIDLYWRARHPVVSLLAAVVRGIRLKEIRVLPGSCLSENTTF